MRRRVYLLRHADVRYTDGDGRFLPDPNAVSLTAEGRVQARAVADSLRDVPFDRAVCSGLPRTLETARLVLDGRSVVLEERPALQEIRPGGAGAVPPEKFERTFLASFYRPATREDRFLGGETWGSLQDRVLPCFRELVADPSWRHLLVVGHGGVNRVIVLELLGAGLAALGHIEQDPAGLTVLDLDGDGHAVVRLLNHTPYDPVKASLLETTMEKLFRDLRLS